MRCRWEGVCSRSDAYCLRLRVYLRERPAADTPLAEGPIATCLRGRPRPMHIGAIHCLCNSPYAASTAGVGSVAVIASTRAAARRRKIFIISVTHSTMELSPTSQL